MNTLYRITEKLKAELDANVLLNTVTFGDITDVDLDKGTIFPLAHVMLGNATITDSTLNIGINIMFIDIVDESKTTGDNFYGNDNEHDVLNSMLAAATKTTQELKRGISYKEGFHVAGDGDVEFFTDRFENKLAGVSLDLNIEVTNASELC
tara:strand:- start:836 stop:1288 length:453 start_codon:yes stop_codon:yes gene_type:complete